MPLNGFLRRAREAAERLMTLRALRRKRAYVALFVGDAANAGLATLPDAAIVLGDLAKFCRAYDSTFDPDPATAAYLAGRRDVFLRITAHLALTEAEVMHLDPAQPMETDDE